MGEMTQADLARRVGVTDMSVRRWLKKTVPSAEDAEKIAAAVGRSRIEGLAAAGYLPPELAELDVLEMAAVFARLPPDLRALVRSLAEGLARREERRG